MTYELPESRMQRGVIEIALVRNRYTAGAQDVDRAFSLLIAIEKPVKPFDLRERIVVVRHCRTSSRTEAPSGLRESQVFLLSGECSEESD